MGLLQASLLSKFADQNRKNIQGFLVHDFPGFKPSGRLAGLLNCFQCQWWPGLSIVVVTICVAKTCKSTSSLEPLREASFWL